MNTENSGTNEPHRFKLDLADKLYLRNPNKKMPLANLVFITNGKILSQNTITINLKFLHQLGIILLIYLMVYFIDDIQDYFEFIIEKHETLTEDLPIEIYPNKKKKKNVFKIRTGYKLG